MINNGKVYDWTPKKLCWEWEYEGYVKFVEQDLSTKKIEIIET